MDFTDTAWFPPAGAIREIALRQVAHADVRDGLTGARSRFGSLVRLLPGFGTEAPTADDVAIVSRIIGRDVRMIPDRWGRTGEDRRVNVALLRSQLRRWAARDANGLRRTDGAA